MSRVGGGRVRIIAGVFFVLLALQLVIRYARPAPAPAWSRVAVIACCAGIVVCLVIQFFSERAARPADEDPPETPPNMR